MSVIGVLDDAEPMRHVLHDALVDAGHEVYVCANPDELRDCLRQRHTDLLVLDLILIGQRQGLDLLEEVRGIPGLERLPILVMSGDVQALREHEDLWNQIPCVELLEKPFRLEELEAAVSRLLSDEARRPVNGASRRDHGHRRQAECAAERVIRGQIRGQLARRDIRKPRYSARIEP